MSRLPVLVVQRAQGKTLQRMSRSCVTANLRKSEGIVEAHAGEPARGREMEEEK